jgi:hypothetical protein
MKIWAPTLRGRNTWASANDTLPLLNSLQGPLRTALFDTLVLYLRQYERPK